jgi:hypothetical protein
LEPLVVTPKFPVNKTVAAYQARLNKVPLNRVEEEVEIERAVFIVELNNHHR